MCSDSATLAGQGTATSVTNPNPQSEHLDPVSWDRLIESIGPPSCLVVIGSWMGRSLSAWITAEDIWQESLVLSWRSREQHVWRGPRAYRGWLLEIARNRIHDHARRMNAQKRGGGNQAALFSEMGVEEDATFAGLLPGGSTTPSRISSTNERASQMNSALEELPEDQAGIVRRHLFEECPMPDIAKELGIGLSAAWYRFRVGSEQYAKILARNTSLAPPERGSSE